MPGYADLHAVALDYLAACAAALDATPAGAPPRQLVTAGPPAWDCCPMLAVHVGGPSTAPSRVPAGALQPLHRFATTGVVTLVTLTATILRCSAAYGQEAEFLPAAAAETAVAAVTNADVWAITNYLLNGVTEGFPGILFEKCGEHALDNPVALAVQGGCAGWQIPLRVNLPGYASA